MKIIAKISTIALIILAFANFSVKPQTNDLRIDGVHYDLLRTHYEWRVNPPCTINSKAGENEGKFKIETRYYRRFEAGVTVESWIEDVECGWTGECREVQNHKL